MPLFKEWHPVFKYNLLTTARQNWNEPGIC